MEQLVTSLSQDTAKAVQEKQLLLSRLLARLAHEIRNPLSSLDIHTQLLEEDLAHAPPEVRARSAARFRIIRTEIERLNDLVKQFLSLAGRSSVNRQPVEIGPIAEHVCALFRPEAAAHGIDIAAALPPGLPPVVADPDQLTQALVNLVLNAIQAVGHDGRVEVAASADNVQMRITVRDTGPGIVPENSEALFEPFFTTKEDGTGLGLWIVRQIAVAHAGSIHATNAPGRGALFTLTLPVANAPKPDFAPKANRDAILPPANRPDNEAVAGAAGGLEALKGWATPDGELAVAAPMTPEEGNHG